MGISYIHYYQYQYHGDINSHDTDTMQFQELDSHASIAIL